MDLRASKHKISTITVTTQQLVCCSVPGYMLWEQALAGACGRQLHRAALNCHTFIQRERAATGVSPESHRHCP
jgi:hypothetical protein